MTAAVLYDGQYLERPPPEWGAEKKVLCSGSEQSQALVKRRQICTSDRYGRHSKFTQVAASMLNSDKLISTRCQPGRPR